MDGDYCIVTGANTGIGKEVAAGLMSQGAHVIMACRHLPNDDIIQYGLWQANPVPQRACRNMDACEVARQELQQWHPPGSCTCSKLDLSDQDSVRNFAKQQLHELKQRKQHLKVLVNNAGVMGVGPGPRGEDQHLTVNHLGPFLLTNMLTSGMTEGSRIINVASRAALWGHVAIRDGAIAPALRFWFAEYARSKLCNILFTAELQRRFQAGKGIVAVAVSPGFVNTTIFRSFPSPVHWCLQRVVPLVSRSPQQGAEVAVYAAISPDLRADRALPLFLHDCKPHKLPKLAEDRQLAADLWAASAAAVDWQE